MEDSLLIMMVGTFISLAFNLAGALQRRRALQAKDPHMQDLHASMACDLVLGGLVGTLLIVFGLVLAISAQ